MGGLAGELGQILIQGLRQRRSAKVRGVVQGVGFRPFVYNLARALGLTGWVVNNAAGVELSVQGTAAALDEFFARLQGEAPPLTRIESVETAMADQQPGETEFIIRASTGGTRHTLISPDVCVCEACLAEMRDPTDRRFGYPFINCTHCGPRYTIIRDLPYDRPNTTMAGFEMCPQCRAEYEDPTDRRFHAQPIACPVCGPRLWLADASGAEIDCADPVARAAEALRQGKIVAIKGLGGFHLAADALNRQAVERLRRRKGREAKPFAVMVSDIRAALRFGYMDDAEEAALASRERPIVLCEAEKDGGLAPAVHPGSNTVGLMLPYTPLHYLLMDQGFEALVMTSGNLSDEPICIDNDEAAARIGVNGPLGPVCDVMLLHDRPIHLRADDSVARVAGGALRLVRRSRGYAPSPLFLAPALAPEGCPPVMAVGAHLKNTLCLLRGREAFLSQHVGDLDDVETLRFFGQTVDHLSMILDCSPRIIAADLHPDYLSTRWAQDRGLPLTLVQHHHAHAAAVMAEHGLEGPVLALGLDGVGLGEDGTSWGGELLLARLDSYERLGRLRPFSLPGGDHAVRQPWRTGLSLLIETLGPEKTAQLNLPLVHQYADKLPLVAGMIQRNINAPRTSSLGRLFDGVSAICGVCYEAHYEGQAAIEFEQAMGGKPSTEHIFFTEECDGLVELDWRPMVASLLAEAILNAGLAETAGSMHKGLVAALAQWAIQAAEKAGVEDVVLGGGCLNNRYILTELPPLLEARRLRVYTPAAIPAGDGGLSLGQAVVAAARWRLGKIDGMDT